MYLENVPIVFGTLPMEQAILHRAGVFGVKSEPPSIVPVEYNDGRKTLRSNVPTVKCWVGLDGYTRILDVANPDYIIRCRVLDDGTISVLGMESNFTGDGKKEK